MKLIDIILSTLFILVVCLALVKVNLVFEFKRNFEHLDKVQEKISSLGNQKNLAPIIKSAH